jgi:AcrR family transcriptional regulator
MQIIKDGLRVLILEAAEQEFLQNGFVNASLRVIAKKSGTTIGNLYHYFPNKEAIFDELVKNEYDTFLHLMAHNENPEAPRLDISNNLDKSWHNFFQAYLTTLMPIFTKSFLLLIDRSQNTKYASAKNKVLDMFIQHIHMHFIDYGIKATPGFENVLAEQILAGLLYIIQTCEDTLKKRQLISDMFAFFIEGILHFS